MEDTGSHWQKTALLPRFPVLDRDLAVDVAVVGGGITGITTAYLLKQAGLAVALVERERCAGVDTGHTTAHLTAVIDLRLHELQRRFGSRAARSVWDAGTAATELIARLVETEGIDCRFKWCPGYLHAAAADEDPSGFRREAETAATLGIAAEFRDAVPLFDVPGVAFPRQAMFHPLAYLAALLRKLPGDKSHVFEMSPVREFESEPRRLVTSRGRIAFNHLIHATHNPLTGLASTLSASLLQTKLSLYSSYALGARLPRGRLPEGLFWDTADPYNYLRVEDLREHAYAIYGGEDHKTGQESDTAARFERLAARLREFAPEAEIDARWSGQVIETNDGLPFIGQRGEHEFLATGFAGNGMTFGTVAAMMAADALLGRPNAWRKIFDPARKPIRGGAWDYIRENKDYPLRLVRDRLARPRVEALDEIAPGEGKVVQVGRRKVAACRDDAGRLTMCSAVCTHLQCIVGWNPAEKTWDCPCHGSRFHPDGRVISGPAEEPLTRLSLSTQRPLRPRKSASESTPRPR